MIRNQHACSRGCGPTPVCPGAVSWPLVALHVERLGGLDRLSAVSELLQRTRSADATGGVWEAADVQWWWRRRRQTDDRPVPVWFDDIGPCGAVVLTDFGGRWQGDALVVPRTVGLEVVWSELLHETERADAPALEVLASEEDRTLLDLLEASGFTAAEKRSGVTWMDAADCPASVPVPEGHRVVDRSSHAKAPHPMATRNGDEIEARLRQCSLYDPELDLAVYAPSGEPAAYGLSGSTMSRVSACSSRCASRKHTSAKDWREHSSRSV